MPPATFEAVSEQNLERLELLLHENDASPNEVYEGMPLLYHAAQQGDLFALKLLLERGAAIDGRRQHTEERFNDTTAAYIAAREGHTECLKALIRAHADLQLRSQLGMSAAYIASQQGQAQCLELLIKAEAHLNAHNVLTQRSLAWAAAQNGRDECLDLLLRHDADADAPDKNGVTPAFKAAENHHLGCLLLLVQNASDLKTAPTDYSNFNGLSPLAVARHKRFHDVVALLTIALSEKHWSTESLLAASEDRLLRVGLAHAFSMAPGKALRRGLNLARSFRARGEHAMHLDLEGGVKMLEASSETQMILGALFGHCLKPEAVQMLGRSAGVLDRALLATCTEFLAFASVQEALFDRWRLVWLSDGDHYASPATTEQAMHWLVDFTRWAACLALIVLTNGFLLLAIACFPPLRQVILEQMTTRVEAAKEVVVQRNQPVGPDADHVISLKLEGVEVGYLFTYWPLATQRKALAKFERSLMQLAHDKSQSVYFYFPLFRPEGKFWTTTCFNLAYTLLLTVAGGGERDMRVVLLVWSAQIVLKPLFEHPNRRLSIWVLDLLNPLQFAAGLLATIGLSSNLIGNPTHMASQLGVAAISWSIVLNWSVTAFRVMQRFAALGPHALMLGLMLADVFRFIVLVSGITFGFAGALTFLMRAPFDSDVEEFDYEWRTQSSYVSDKNWECSEFNDETWGKNVFSSLLVLIEIALDTFDREQGAMDCLHKSPIPVVGPSLLLAYKVLIVLLGLNMVIAMMSTTFEKVREHLASYYMFRTALLVALWDEETAIPPPLWILGVPYYVVRLLAAAVKSVVSLRHSESKGIQKQQTEASLDIRTVNSVHTTGVQLELTHQTLKDKATSHDLQFQGFTHQTARERTRTLLQGVNEYMSTHGSDSDDNWKTRLAKSLLVIRDCVERNSADIHHNKQRMGHIFNKIELLDMKLDHVVHQCGHLRPSSFSKPAATLDA